MFYIGLIFADYDDTRDDYTDDTTLILCLILFTGSLSLTPVVYRLFHSCWQSSPLSPSHSPLVFSPSSVGDICFSKYFALILLYTKLDPSLQSNRISTLYHTVLRLVRSGSKFHGKIIYQQRPFFQIWPGIWTSDEKTGTHTGRACNISLQYRWGKKRERKLW